MASDDDNKLRKPVESESGGLAHNDRRRRRPSTSGLSYPDIEIPLEGIGAGLTPIADRLALEEVSEPGEMEAVGDLGLAQLLADQRNEKVRILLDQATAKLKEGQAGAALESVEAAIRIDRNADEARLLKSRCLMALGHFAAAAQELAYVRSRMESAEPQAVVLRLEAECRRARAKRLEDRLVDLVAREKLLDALSLVEEGLGWHPGSIVFLYHKASIQWIQGDRDGARRTLVEARRHLGRDNVDLIAELERRMEFGPHRAVIDRARDALRRGDPASAIEELETCAAAMSGNEQFDGLLAYARDRQHPGVGLRLGRKAPVPAQSLVRQQTLRWILAEEIRQGEAALRSGDSAAACRAFEEAHKIDPDCGAVRLKHARSLLAGCRQTIHVRRRSDPDGLLRDLERAEELAAASTIDANCGVPAAALLKSIRETRSDMIPGS